MKKTKWLLQLMIATVCMFGLTACSDDDDDNPDTPYTPSEELADYTILL